MSSLDRFVSAQNLEPGGFVTALEELRAGRKRSHWIWFVFPQLAGLGRSSMARAYAIRDVDEAREYFAHPLLGSRLVAATEAVAAHVGQGQGIGPVMATEIDALKLVSSLTLFEAVAREADDERAARFLAAASVILADAARDGFPRCRFTLEQLAS